MRGRIFIVSGLLCLAVSAFVLVGNLAESQQAEQASQAVLAELNPVVQTISNMTPDYEIDPERDMPEQEIDGRAYIGYLTIEDLGLELPVLSQWDYVGLKVAPGRYYGSVYTGDMIIAGHNYRSHFGSLHRIPIGTSVQFIDMDGNLFAYEVSDVETLSKYQVAEMEQGDWDLTLFTCTYGGQSRVAVRCSEVKV